MTVYIILTTAGTDSGPFSLYSNIDGFVTPFETGVAKSTLLAGYTSTLVPNFTATVRVKSTGVCTNYVDITVSGTTTTTTSSTSSTSSTTTTTTTIVASPTCMLYSFSNGNEQSMTIYYVDCLGQTVSQYIAAGGGGYFCGLAGQTFTEEFLGIVGGVSEIEPCP